MMSSAAPAVGGLPLRTALLRSAKALRPNHLFGAGLRVEQRHADLCAEVDAMPNQLWRELNRAQLHMKYLRGADGRVQLIRTLLKTLELREINTTVVEFYSGPDVSGAIALPRAEYILVSNDPLAAAIASLPPSFFELADLEKIGALGTHTINFLAPTTQALLKEILLRALPNLRHFEEEVADFAARPEQVGTADLCLSVFWGAQPSRAMEAVVRDEGFLVTIDKPGVAEAVEAVTGQAFMPNRNVDPPLHSIQRDDLMQALNDRLAELPGYSLLGPGIRIYQKRPVH